MAELQIRFGDPCYLCGVPMTPASRIWCADTIPAGMRKHAGRALCSSCANSVRRGTHPASREVSNCG